MKKTIKIIAVLLCVTALLFSFTACGKKAPVVVEESETCIVITASSDRLAITETTTLLDYMNALKEGGELQFEISGGMITSINGIANAADYSSCWMLYTSDETHANTAWGTVDYDGNVYGSAVLGAEALVIKEGCVYIWSYVTF